MLSALQLRVPVQAQGGQGQLRDLPLQPRSLNRGSQYLNQENLSVHSAKRLKTELRFVSRKRACEETQLAAIFFETR